LLFFLSAEVLSWLHQMPKLLSMWVSVCACVRVSESKRFS